MATSSKKRGRLSAVTVPDGAVPPERPGPTGGKRDANRRARVRALAEAAVPLFLEHGIDRVRIDDITRAAGVAKGSFYRYFEDKPALVAALFEPVQSAVEQALARATSSLAAVTGDRQAVLDAYVQLGVDLAAVVAGNGAVLRLYLQERRGPATGARAPLRALADDLEEAAISLTRLAQERGLLRPFPPEVSALAVVGAGEQLLFSFLSGRKLPNPGQLPAHVVSLIMRGLEPGD